MIAPEDRERLGAQEVEQAAGADWRVVLGRLHARFRTGDFATGVRLLDAVAAAAEEHDHHPDLDLRYTSLEVRLRSHDVAGLTRRDVRLATRISELAGELGVRADPAAPVCLEIALDTADEAAVRPFWRAVYGPDAVVSDGEVSDPAGRLPTLWFRGTTAHDEPRQRFHLDVWVPADQAEARVAAVLAAGGRLVSDDEAPSFWVLADPEGNKACVCTWQERERG
ncbi:4a-hydroxytetrahydrobiopterin dehydratase [Nocardioides ferulae]|uniref:4a-hydroxytetrahydrobiopterin dehydratase n=1 Tax=Nocardioides ferulae TaxID=2340821 RepID=UPI001F0B8E7C|nr:4a-hydroxytetrahydrobiopterin dehydratase [Nocardioides ferulae]